MPSTDCLTRLAECLNDIHGAFWLRKTTATEARSIEARAANVACAMQILMWFFFDKRRQAWRTAPVDVLIASRDCTINSATSCVP